MNKIIVDYAKLKRYCNLTPSQLLQDSDLGDYNKLGNFTFKDNHSKILLVAHCDTVFTGCRGFTIYKPDTSKNDTMIMSPQLDDRLGVYTICEMLPSLGINCDILLTDDEELGLSTAREFNSYCGNPKTYNWIGSFDRRGVKPVLYRYDTPELRDKLKAVDIVPDRGSFSDIIELSGFKVSGINFGVGYYDEHTPLCYAPLKDYVTCINTFLRFYNRYKDVKLKYTIPVYTDKHSKGHNTTYINNGFHNDSPSVYNWAGSEGTTSGLLMDTGRDKNYYKDWDFNRCEECLSTAVEVDYYQDIDLYLCDRCYHAYYEHYD